MPHGRHHGGDPGRARGAIMAANMAAIRRDPGRIIDVDNLP
ncbi:MAG TPA: hypothetical protein VFZ18_10635 [Longimicrobiaceae bacterium]